jgi:tetratricopeptide (TPR) repeat protein
MVEARLLERENNAETAGAAPPTNDTELRTVAARLTQERFKPLAASCYALLGLLDEPETAAQIPNRTMLFPTALLERFSETTLKREGVDEPAPFRKQDTPLIIDYLILRLLDGEYEEVVKALNAMPDFNPAENAPLAHFAAEFFYDYGNALRAAEIFSRFPPETAPSYAARQADALWVSGYVPAARALWTALGASDREEDGANRARSLYNLAATAQDKTQEAAFLKRQLALSYDTCHDLGVIRYSRLLPTAEALELLQQHGATKQTPDDPLSESAMAALQNEPLIALELVRRGIESGTLRRAVAETWLLLNEYEADARLYEWACYFFNYQRRYDEAALLVKNAGRHGIGGVWLDMHEALRMAREGGFSDALSLLVKLPEDEHWQIAANIARIQEARRAPTAALGYYEKAATLVRDNIQASRIHFRRALCLRSLARDDESRAALRLALELDPDFLAARLELRRPLASFD